MARPSQLFLYEEIMLLALRDEKGTVATSYAGHLIAGAVLAELLFDGRVVLDGTRKQLVEVKQSSPTGDPVIDECLALLAASSRRRSLKGWLTKLAGIRRLTSKAARQLVDRGIVRTEQDKVLFIFTRKVYPQVNPGPEKKIVERLREAITSNAPGVSPRTAVLVALVSGAGLLGQTIGRKEARLRRKRIAEIARGTVAGRATQEVIAAQQAAVAVAAIMPAIIATSSS